MQGYYAEKNKQRGRERLAAYLERLQRSGTELYIDGEAVPAVEVMRRTVQEECAYMADYIMEKPGRISQVRFDRVEP